MALSSSSAAPALPRPSYLHEIETAFIDSTVSFYQSDDRCRLINTAILIRGEITWCPYRSLLTIIIGIKTRCIQKRRRNSHSAQLFERKPAVGGVVSKAVSFVEGSFQWWLTASLFPLPWQSIGKVVLAVYRALDETASPQLHVLALPVPVGKIHFNGSTP